MADKVKVSVLETNGVEELEGPAERSLTADIVDLSPAVDGYDDVDGWLRNVGGNVLSSILPPIVLTHNATMSNNQLIGYSNLTNNPLVIGFKSKLVRITVQTSNSNPDYAIDFFGTAADGGNNNGFFRHTVVNASPNYSVVTGSPTFDPGDEVGIYYRDQGQNANDLSLGLFFEAVL